MRIHEREEAKSIVSPLSRALSKTDISKLIKIQQKGGVPQNTAYYKKRFLSDVKSVTLFLYLFSLDSTESFSLFGVDTSREE